MADVTVSDSSKPHTAVVSIDVKVYEKRPSGELSGRSIDNRTIRVAIEGEDKDCCLRRLSEALENLKSYSK